MFDFFKVRIPNYTTLELLINVTVQGDESPEKYNKNSIKAPLLLWFPAHAQYTKQEWAGAK